MGSKLGKDPHLPVSFCVNLIFTPKVKHKLLKLVCDPDCPPDFTSNWTKQERRINADISFESPDWMGCRDDIIKGPSVFPSFVGAVEEEQKDETFKDVLPSNSINVSDFGPLTLQGGFK